MLACDGVWERYVHNNQKMVELIGGLLSKYGNQKTVIEKLFDQLVAKNQQESCGFDNMTAQLIVFQ